jgi:hypothetical protein
MEPVSASLPGVTVLPPDGEGAAVDVLWNGWRPLVPLDGLAADARARAHRSNVATRRGDLRRFEAFLSRFVAEARAARTMDALLAHGRPRRPDFAWERGATRDENADMQDVNGGFAHALRDALLALERVRAPLEGRRPALDVSVEASAAVRAKLGRHESGVCVSATDGTATVAYATGAVRTSSRLDASGRVGAVSGAARVAGGSASVSVGRDRIESVELRAGAAYARVAGTAVAAGIAAGRTLAAGRASIAAEARLGVRLQLLDPEIARRALSRDDAWRRDR